MLKNSACFTVKISSLLSMFHSLTSTSGCKAEACGFISGCIAIQMGYSVNFFLPWNTEFTRLDMPTPVGISFVLPNKFGSANRLKAGVPKQLPAGLKLVFQSILLFPPNNCCLFPACSYRNSYVLRRIHGSNLVVVYSIN